MCPLVFCSALAEGTILDNQQLICLYMLSQLLERELDKCLRLVVAIPMDMSNYFGEFAPHAPLTQIVLRSSQVAVAKINLVTGSFES